MAKCDKHVPGAWLRSEMPPRRAPLPPGWQEHIDGLSARPAYILGARKDILAWNTAARVVFRDFETIPPSHRNLVWLAFTDEGFRRRMVDWEGYAQRLLGFYRAACGRHVDDPSFVALTRALLAASPAFAAWWEQHDVEEDSLMEKLVEHPDVGPLASRYSTTALLRDNWEMRLIINTPRDELTRASIKTLLRGLSSKPLEGTAQSTNP